MVIPVTVLWLAIVVDLFRRHDLSGWARAAWLLLVLVVSAIRPLVYIIVTWMHAEDERNLSMAMPASEAPTQFSTGRHATEKDGS
jgi:hypothetical protein